MPGLRDEINWRYRDAAWRILQAINKATSPRQQARYAFVVSGALALATTLDPTLQQTLGPTLTGAAALLSGEAWGKFLDDVAGGDSAGGQALSDEAILDRLQQLLPPDRAGDILNNQAEILRHITGLEVWQSQLVTISEHNQALAQTLLLELNAIGGDVRAIRQQLEQVAGNMATRQQVEQLRKEITRPAPTIPLQRPPRATHFTGREKELADLLQALQPGRIVTLVGPGGIGKTALAAEAIHTLITGNQPPPDFPGGVIYYSFYGKPAITAAADHIARSCGFSPADIDPDPLVAAQRALSGRTPLLILDGAEEADHLEALLRIRGNAGTLITSRSHKDVRDVEIEVSLLPLGDAVALLQAWGGRWAQDQDSASAICELVGNLALAVRLAGAYIHESRRYATEYLAWLRATPLQALDFGERREESVPVLVNRSLTQLSSQAQAVLALFGCLALAPLDELPLAFALDLNQSATRRAFDELVRYGLLLRPSQSYEITHPLLHTYIREHLVVSREQLERLGQYYVQLANSENQRGLEGYRVLDHSRPHIIALFDHLQAAEQWVTTNDLAWAVQDYLYMQGRSLDLITALLAGVLAARALSDHRAEDIRLGNLGIAHATLGQVERAIDFYEQALTLSREIGDPRAEGTWLGYLGSAYTDLGQLERAITFHEQALPISRGAADRRGEGNALGGLGSAYLSLGQFERAIAFHEQALAISREIGDRRNEGAWLASLGNAYTELGQVERAIGFHRQALAISREIGDRQGEGNHLGNLGLAYAGLGQLEQAIDLYQQALTISREIGDRRGEGRHLGNLGVTWLKQDQPEQALGYIRQALAIARTIGDPLGEGINLHRLGEIAARQGNVDEAAAHYQQALTIFETLKSPRAAETQEALARLNSPTDTELSTDD